MASHRKSSRSSIPVTQLDFPEKLTHFKALSFRSTSSEFGKPQIISISQPIRKSSSYNESSTFQSPSRGSFSKKSSHACTSRVLVDTKHRRSVKPTRLEFRNPCSDSFVFGAPTSYIGECPGQGKKQFNLTEDPRKRICLKNPKRTNFKKISQSNELAKTKELVINADYTVSVSELHSSKDSISEIIDVGNPLGLDFQGTDYKNTYERDEQSCQNQIEYRKVRRVLQRQNVKLETAYNIQKEQHLERIAIPKHFVVNGPSVQIKPNLRLSKVLNETRNLHGRLVRAEKKPEVLQRLKKEEDRRRERYKELYIKKKAKLAQKLEDEIQAKKSADENKAMNLAEKDIQDLLVEVLNGDMTAKKLEFHKLPERRRFPHNITETIKFRYNLKKSKRFLRDRAIVKQKFYEEMGKQKKIPESRLEISTDSCPPSSWESNEEQSTNDEDDMVVGQKKSKFLLRGFRYKLGTNLRGKLNQHEISSRNAIAKVKGCIRRDEWFDSLISKNIQGKENKSKEMNLFPRKLGLETLHVTSAIRKFRNKTLGRHYDRTTSKKFYIRKPRTLKVRKFNLIKYLFGNEASKLPAKSVKSLSETNQKRSTLDYLRHKTEEENSKRAVAKYQRMQYLRISCPQEKGLQDKSKCVDSNSGDSDWVPEEKSEEQIVSDKISVRMRGNMPAPENRETTLRKHPKRPRDYKTLRVPSSILNEFVKKQHIPVMVKLRDDKKVKENVRTVQNTEYANKFNARHHHDHWNPTQHKTINVRYSRKIIKPQVKPDVDKTRAKVSSRCFQIASKNSELNFSLPKININEMIEKEGIKIKSGIKKQIEPEELSKTEDANIHSLPDGQLREFPGRDKFIQFINEIKSLLKNRLEMNNTELTIDRSAFINELKEDLQSIESCLSSLSSSECTNLSNDSGSFLMAGDKKIPLDYFRKSVVPFEEMNRQRIVAIPIDPSKEGLNPYKTVPFAGQKSEQMLMTATKDNFFTFNTRLQNGMRQRLEVKADDSAKKLLGPKRGPKAPCQVATDIDALYIEDLKQPPVLKLFKWNSCRTMIKEALRKKFESMLIQGEIVRTKINDRRNEDYYQQMMNSKELFEKLFAKWEKKEYEAAMEFVNKVKPYYEATDVFRKEYQELSKQYTVLSMDIVYIENDWRSRTILQNFHYLLADVEWRQKNDWIHRNADGSLEGFQESITKRCEVNIRQRDKDDAWAVKEYYDNVYLKNLHPIIVVFSNATEFISGIENLRSKTFVLFKELHYTLGILAELKQKHQEISDWCTTDLESKKKFVENKCANKYFMEKRAEKLKAQFHALLGDPIDETFGDKQMSQIKGICKEMYKSIIPVGDQMNLSTLEQVAAISEVLNELLDKFENIPSEQQIRVEKKHRRLLAYRRNMSKQAILVERRIASELIKVRSNLAPPFQKHKREGKLQRSELKKVTRVSHKKRLSVAGKAKSYKALHGEGDPNGVKEARESLDVIGDIQESIVPFYFDHFLKMIGYTPNYDFKTQIEIRDGPEIDRMKIKKLLPEVLDKFEKWQAKEKRIMEENINKYPEMYQNDRL